MGKQKICAIVPSYKEEKRIGRVLEPLEKSMVDEIIVVDDCSNDNTQKVVKKFKKVKYIKNKQNLGKASSISRGVDNTSAEILFFCDADLINLSSEDINKIIKPVLNGDFEMSLGPRFRINKKFKLLLITGQRALKREVWERLPDFFKKGFRIELGLNFTCKNYYCENFDYSQTIKEGKYGLLKGFYNRLSMMWDITTAILFSVCNFLNTTHSTIDTNTT